LLFLVTGQFHHQPLIVRHVSYGYALFAHRQDEFSHFRALATRRLRYSVRLATALGFASSDVNGREPDVESVLTRVVSQMAFAGTGDETPCFAAFCASFSFAFESRPPR
jgi:hypothetical protein